MQYDRKITISAGSNRRAMTWQQQTMLISELWARLQTPARGTETLAEYLNMKKAQQDDLKDVGGFMAGTLSGPRRKANNVTGRDVITLDLDNIPSGGTEDVLRRVDALGCGYTVTFTKAVYEASITLAEPMDADDAITVMVLNVLGSIPADADLEVLVTNNANDTEPVWEDATQDVKNGNNHVFTNQTAANGFAFNFKVNVGRGTSDTGGYISNIGGAFE